MDCVSLFLTTESWVNKFEIYAHSLAYLYRLGWLSFAERRNEEKGLSLSVSHYHHRLAPNESNFINFSSDHTFIHFRSNRSARRLFDGLFDNRNVVVNSFSLPEKFTTLDLSRRRTIGGAERIFSPHQPPIGRTRRRYRVIETRCYWSRDETSRPIVERRTSISRKASVAARV